MTASFFIGIILAAIAALALACGLVMLACSWIELMLAGVAAARDREWPRHEIGTAKIIASAGFISLSISAIAGGAVHVFRLLPTI